MAPNVLSLDVNEFVLTHWLAPHIDARTRSAACLYITSAAPLSRRSQSRIASAQKTPYLNPRASLALLIALSLSLSRSPWRRPRRRTLAAKACLAAGGSGPRRGWRRPSSASASSTPASASRSTAPPRRSSTWTPRSSSPCGGRRTTLPSTSVCRCWPPVTSSPARRAALPMLMEATHTRTPSRRRRSTRRRARLPPYLAARRAPASGGRRRSWQRGGWSSGTCASSCRCAGRRGPPTGLLPRRRLRRGAPRPASPAWRPSTGATATPTLPCATPYCTARNPSRIVLNAELMKNWALKILI
jgi:hypothetical protein